MYYVNPTFYNLTKNISAGNIIQFVKGEWLILCSLLFEEGDGILYGSVTALLLQKITQFVCVCCLHKLFPEFVAFQ